MTQIDDTTTDELREVVAKAMTRMASQGSVPAAKAVLKLLDEVERRDITAQHKAIIEGDDKERAAEYLGELGLTVADAETYLGRSFSESERTAHAYGTKSRQLEIRAIELARARSGGDVPRWALK